MGNEEKTASELLSEAGDKAEKTALQVIDKQDATPPAKPLKPGATDNGKGDKPSENGELDEKTVNDIKEGKLIPKHRFDEVSARAKLYESFGTPEEIEAKIKSASSQPKKDETPLPEPLTDEDNQMKNYLEKLHPGLKKLPDLMKQIMDMMKSQEQEKASLLEQKKKEWDRHTDKGVEFIKKIAKESGLDSEDEDLMEDVIEGIVRRLHKNKELSDKFYLEKDIEVLKPIFDDYFKKFFSETQRKAAAKLLEDKKREKNLPKPPVKGGSPHLEPPDKEPQTLEEAGARAVERLYHQ